MAQIPKEEASAPAGTNGSSDPTVKGGAFSQTTEAETPFGFGRVSWELHPVLIVHISQSIYFSMMHAG